MLFTIGFPRIVKRIRYIEDNIEYTKYYLFGQFLYLEKQKAYEWRKTIFLNMLLSYRKYKNLVAKNYYNLDNIFQPKKIELTNEKVDIIVPIYNGYEYLNNFFDSIIENTDINFKLIVINDNSPDERVLPLLEKYQSVLKEKMILIKNDTNIGFVQNINKGLKIATENVVIINSDVIVPPKWASRLLYPIITNEKVASVTPFSNAATIFSLPENCIDNELNGDLLNIDNALSTLNIPVGYINFPTGVGFCMAMNKNAIKKVGLLDEIFGKGYGEENDWCQRVLQKGYINTIAENLFVWHKHGGSFNSKEKKSLIDNNLNIIKKRYPKYIDSVLKLQKDNRYLSLRFWAELLYMKAISSDIQIWFDHTWGGGTEVYFKNKVEELKNKTMILRVQNHGSNFYYVSYYHKNYTNKLCIDNISDIEKIIEQIVPNTVVINNLASYKNYAEVLDLIEKIKNKTGMKVVLLGHDFQYICPSINMVNYENKYCNCMDKQKCISCFKKFKSTPIKCSDINIYQQKWCHIVEDVVDEIIVFSNSTKEIFNRFFSDTENKISIIPHKIAPIRKVDVKVHQNLVIGVLGNININKGMNIIIEMSKLLSKYPNVKITIIGNCSKKHIKHVKITGKYDVHELPNIIEREQIDIIFIPSICPETFSYTTSEAMSMGLPVACFNIGAQAERNKEGCIISKINARTALEEILLFTGSRKRDMTKGKG